MKKRWILLLMFILISVIALPVEVSTVPTKEISFDYFAGEIAKYVFKGAEKLKDVAIPILTSLFLCQLVWDIVSNYATGNYQSILKTVFRKSFVFTIYLIVINAIINGKFFETVKTIAFTTVSLLTGGKGVQNIGNIWNVKNEITWSLWKLISSVWGPKSFVPGEFLRDFCLTVVVIILIVLINISFFLVMVDLFKAIVSFVLCLNLSSILLPLGVTDITKGIYSISKVISMSINLAVKIISINVFSIVGFQAVTKNLQSLQMDKIDNMGALLTSDVITFIMLSFIVALLINKLEVSF